MEELSSQYKRGDNRLLTSSQGPEEAAVEQGEATLKNAQTVEPKMLKGPP